jgi:hypothetical protein
MRHGARLARLARAFDAGHSCEFLLAGEYADSPGLFTVAGEERLLTRSEVEEVARRRGARVLFILDEIVEARPCEA